MLIQSKYPAAPTVNNVTWSFQTDRDGRHVCNVTDEKSVAMLLSVVDIYSEAEPLDPVSPIFQPEPVRDPAAEPPMSIETIDEAEFDRLGQPAGPTVIQATAPIPPTTDEPAMTVDEATAMFAEKQAEQIRIEGEEAEARQQASLAQTVAGLGLEPGSDFERTVHEHTETDPTPNAHPLDHDGDGKPGGFYVPPAPEPNPLDPNNEFPMDPGVNASAIGHVTGPGAASTFDAAAVRDPDADKPSAEDPNLTNAQVAAKKRSAKKKQAKRSPRRK